jgi:hypothetical protein
MKNKFCCIPMPSNKTRKKLKTDKIKEYKKSYDINKTLVNQNGIELNVSKASIHTSSTFKAPGEVQFFNNNQNNKKILENEKGITKTVLVTEMIKNLKKEKTSEKDKENIQEPDNSNRNKEKRENPFSKEEKLNKSKALNSDPRNEEKVVNEILVNLVNEIETPNIEENKIIIAHALNNDQENKETEVKEEIPSVKDEKLIVPNDLKNDLGSKEKVTNKKIPSKILKPTDWEIMVII